MDKFIRLPDGTIINVAHVRNVRRKLSEYDDGTSWVRTEMDMTGDGKGVWINEPPDGPVYSYFDSIAQEIGGDEH